MFKLPNSGSFVAVPGRLAQIEAVDLRLTPVVPDTVAASQGAPPAEATPVADQVAAPAEATSASDQVAPPAESAAAEVERQVAETEQPVEVPVSVVEEKTEAPDGPSVSSKALALLKKMDPETIKEVLSVAGVIGDRDESRTDTATALDSDTTESETESDQVAEQPATDVNEIVSGGGSTAQDSVGSNDGLPGGGEQVTKEQPGGAEADQTPMGQVAAPKKSQTPGLPAGITGEETCAGEQVTAMCWRELENKPGCYFWQHEMLAGAATTWSGACADGLAEETGTITSSNHIYSFDEETLTFTSSNQRHSFTATGHFRRGKPHGQWVVSSPDGGVSEGPFVGGKRNGHWVERSPDGDMSEGPYVDDKWHGHWVTRFSDGGMTEGPLVDGKKHGQWVTRFSDGDVMEGPYVDGREHGQWVTRYLDGSEDTFTYVNGEMQF